MNRRGLPLLAVGVSVTLWSLAYPLSGIVLETASPAVLSVVRFSIALAVLVPFAARRPGFLRTLRSPRTVLLGLTGVSIYNAFINLALLFTTAGTASLVSALLPVFTALLGVLILRERMGWRTIVGLVLATAGVALVAASGLSLDLGVLLCAVGLLGYGLYTVLIRRDVDRADAPDALVLSTATAVWGTVIMVPWMLGELLTGTARLPEGLPGIGSLLILALVVTAPTLVLFNYGAERLPAAISGIATAAVPPLGYALSVLLGETPMPIKVIGGVVALAGILVATVASPRIEASPPGATVMSQPEGPDRIRRRRGGDARS